MEPLTQRQSSILRGVVESHIETSGPIGSHYIAERYGLPLSTATIRNEMGLLEEWGYLTHPHTSSGRLPTDSGYRYYLDHTSFPEAVPESVCARMTDEINPRTIEQTAPEAFLDRISSLLSSMTQEVGLSLSVAPDPSAMMQKIDELKLSLQGLTHILEKPEFHDLNKLKAVLRALEEKIVLKQWLFRKAQEARVSISIGHEHETEALEDCAIVTARYSVGRKGTGAIAILGPKRMPYRQVIPLISRMASMMSSLFGAMDTEES